MLYLYMLYHVTSFKIATQLHDSRAKKKRLSVNEVTSVLFNEQIVNVSHTK